MGSGLWQRLMINTLVNSDFLRRRFGSEALKFEQTISISADPSTVFEAYKDVSGWSQWDPETESASIDGAFSVGTSGKIKPKGSPESKITIVEVTENKSFTVECTLPLCKMQFAHLMSPNEKGTEVINQLEFSGLLGPVFGRLFGKGINKSIPESLNGLKKYVETNN